MELIIKTLLNNIAAIASAVLLFSASVSCERNHEPEPDPEFIGADKASLVIDGTMVHCYKLNESQLAFSRDARQFRMCDDNMSEYFVVTCSAIPTQVGQEVDCVIKWTSDKGVSEKMVTLKAKQLSDDGYIWLWNGKKRVGACVKVLD